MLKIPSKIFFLVLAGVCACASAQTGTMTVGPGLVNTVVRQWGTGSTAYDYLVVGGTSITTSGTSIYLQTGSLTIDVTAGETPGSIAFSSDGVNDGSGSVYLLSRDYGATSLDINGGADRSVSFHITDQFAGAKTTYALFIRGRELMAGREHVGVIDGVKVLTEGKGVVGMLFSDTTVKINNSEIRTTGGVSELGYSSDGIRLQGDAEMLITNSEIFTSAASASAIQTSDGSIVAENILVQTTGDNANALHLLKSNSFGTNKDATVSFTASTISTTGDNAIGLAAFVYGTQLGSISYTATLDGSTVTTSGSGSHAVALSGEGATLSVENGTDIFTGGQNAYAVASAQGDVAVLDSSVRSAQGAALAVSQGGSIAATNSAIAGMNAVQVSDEILFATTAAAITPRANNVTIDGGTLTATGAAIIVKKIDTESTGSIAALITLKNGVQVSSGTGVLLDNQSLKGEINLSIQDGTSVSGMIVGAASADSTTSAFIETGSTWNASADSSFTSLLAGGQFAIDAGVTVALSGKMQWWDSGSLDLGMGAMIDAEVFDVAMLSGKITVNFEDMTSDVIEIARFQSLAFVGSDDANDYFKAGNLTGYFEFTADNKLVFHNDIPEPALSAALLSLGALALATRRRRK